METLEEKASTNQVEKVAQDATSQGIIKILLFFNVLTPDKNDEVCFMIRHLF